ncbi:MAG: HAD hydrolase-like protein [Elusimicrobia bacterium]|nr:HAD hydrolase-like protein [Elusimicrobiota bacterium]
MVDAAQALRDFKHEKKFLVGIDSDGCAFDTMEIKHKECFIPNIINEWDLQAVSKYAREAAEFVNLYSKWRGINRFPALVMVFDLLKEREEVKRRGIKLPQVDSLRKWMEKETKLGNPALEKAVKETNDPVLTRTLKWSKEVNNTVTRFVRGVPPFPFVRENLEAMSKVADIIVVSATPGEALVREWQEHGIDKYVKVIAGQEMGTKKEHLEIAIKGRYDKNNVIMIGDAPGDMKAARANQVLFYPINPGNEDASWERLYKESMKKFTDGEYAGKYEEKLIAEFDAYLPDTPPWKK